MAETEQEQTLMLQGLEKTATPRVAKEIENLRSQIGTSCHDLAQTQRWVQDFTSPYNLAFHLAIDKYTRDFPTLRASRWNPFNKDRVISWEAEKVDSYKSTYYVYEILFSGYPPTESPKKAAIRIFEKGRIPVSLGFNFTTNSLQSISLQMELGGENLAGQINSLNDALILKTGRIDQSVTSKDGDPELNKITDIAEFCYQHFSLARGSGAKLEIGLSENPFIYAHVRNYPTGSSDDPALEVIYNYEEKQNSLVRSYRYPYLNETHIDRGSYGLKFCTNTMGLEQYKRLIVSFFNLVPVELAQSS
jgi:hypothetical protein